MYLGVEVFFLLLSNLALDPKGKTVTLLSIMWSFLLDFSQCW